MQVFYCSINIPLSDQTSNVANLLYPGAEIFPTLMYPFKAVFKFLSMFIFNF